MSFFRFHSPLLALFVMGTKFFSSERFDSGGGLEDAQDFCLRVS
jgi:hypothetical protein